MLGFSPLAGHPLASAGQSFVHISLIASPGSYAVTGNSAWFQTKEAVASGSYVVTWGGVGAAAKGPAIAGSYALAGNPVAFRGGIAAQAGAYSLAGSALSFASRFLVEAGSYVLTGSQVTFAGGFRLDSGVYSLTWGSAATPFFMVADAGSYVVTWGEYELRRTGYDYEPGYAGIGHYLEEQVRLQKLAKIVRPTPRPVQTIVPPLPQAMPGLEPVNPPMAGLLNGIAAPQVQRQPNMAAIKSQARRRAAMALLLAA